MATLHLSRRVFVAGPCLLGLAGVVRGAQTAGSGATAGAAAGAGSSATKWPGFPHQDPAVVREFVGVCHRNIERVREMLAEHPALATCAWDWGYGDWESALGAAAHTGRREIAQVLIEQGARLDLFAAAMLGMTEVVKAMVAAQPGVEATPGPHGIMLLAHAEAGEHAATIEYVKSLPAATREAPAKLSDEEMARYVGEYRTEEGAGVTVSVTRFGLAVKAAGATDVRLTPTSPVSANQFHPAGAPNVRVTFTLVEGVAKRVEFVEAGWFVGATRV